MKTDTPGAQISAGEVRCLTEEDCAGSNRGAQAALPPHHLLLLLLPASTVAIMGAWLLLDWTVDDAAISYAYARNASRGFGLVAQANRPPVEGFSNVLWVALLSPVAGQHHIPAWLALKSLSWVFQAAFLAVAALGAFARGVPLLAAAVFAGLLALEPPLLIWSNAGLETPLLFFETLVLGETLATALNTLSKRSILIAGSVAASCALTRPEGILLSFAGLLVLGCAREIPGSRRLHATFLYATLCGLPLLAYIGFRRFYFHDWLPNTFYAKGGLTGERLLETLTLSPHAITKLLEVASALGGYFGASAVVAVVVGLITTLLRRDALTRYSRAHLGLASAAGFAYVLLPGDWMGEYRYASPAALLLSMAVFHMTVDLWEHIGRPKLPPQIRIALGGAIVATSILWASRINDFRSHLAMPLAEVDERAQLFERAGRLLGINRASLLTQDVGGFLLRDTMEVYDIGMLTDRRIARAIGEWRGEPDRADLHSYVFQEVKPDFISVVAYHAWASQLATDPRLDRDYMPIHAKLDDWVLRRYGTAVESGDYVRKEHVHSNADLVRLRDVLASSRGPK